MKKLFSLVFFSVFLLPCLFADPRLNGTWLHRNIEAHHHSFFQMEDGRINKRGVINGVEQGFNGDYLVLGNVIIVEPFQVSASEFAEIVGWSQLTTGRITPALVPFVNADTPVGQLRSQDINIIRNNMLADGYSVAHVNRIWEQLNLLFSPRGFSFVFLSEDTLLFDGVQFHRVE
jgi:hypothetical protein